MPWSAAENAVAIPAAPAPMTRIMTVPRSVWGFAKKRLTGFRAGFRACHGSRREPKALDLLCRIARPDFARSDRGPASHDGVGAHDRPIADRHAGKNDSTRPNE